MAGHLLLFMGLSGGLKLFDSGPPASPVEIDLTRPPGPPGPPKLGAPKPLVRNAPAGPNVPVEKVPDKPPPPQPPPPQDWVTPGPETKTVEKPAEPTPTAGGAPGGTGTAVQPGGAGLGADYGSPDGKGFGGGGGQVDQLPRLLNKDEVLRNLKRFYPESERRAGREGKVVVYLHIGADGKVAGVDVAESAGPAFDASARQVGKLMLFSPALVRGAPVPVKIRQSIVFRLDD